MKSLKDYIDEGSFENGQPFENIDSWELSQQVYSKEEERYRRTTKQRVHLGYWTAGVVSLWVIWILIILTKNPNWSKLSDNVLMTMLTTTTINILVLPKIVLNAIFNDGRRKPAPKKEKV